MATSRNKDITKTVIKSSSVTMSRFNEMEGVTVYDHIPECHVTFGRVDFIMFPSWYIVHVLKDVCQSECAVK